MSPMPATKTATVSPPKIVRNIGDSITIRGHISAKIIKVWPFGTVDVET